MKKSFWLAVVLGWVFVYHINAQEKWTLQQCMDYARERNFQIQTAGLDEQKSLYDFKQASYQRLPDLNAGGRANWNYGLTQNLTTGVLEHQTLFGSSFFASLSWPVFQGFLLQNQIKTAKKGLELSGLAVEKTIQQVEMQVATGYLEILMAYEQLKAAESQWRASVQQLEKTKELIKAGSLPSGDLKDMEAQAANDYLQFIRAEQNYKLRKLNLALLLQLKDPKQFDVDKNLAHFPVDESLLMKSADVLADSKWSGQIDERLSQARSDLALYQMKSARSGFFPSVSFFSSWNSRYVDRNSVAGYEPDPDNPFRVIGITEISNERVLAPNFRPVLGPPDPFFTQIQDNQGFSFGFQLNIPVFNKFRTRLQVQKAKVDYEKSLLNRETEYNNFRNTIFKLHSDAVSAKEKWMAAQKNAEAALKAYQYALEKFKAGVLTSYDLENFKSRKVNAESQEIQAKYEYLFKLKLLELQLKNNFR